MDNLQNIEGRQDETINLMERCIDNCFECSRTCLETLTHCLQKGGNHASKEHISLLMLCAEICQTSGKFLTAGSPLHVHTCRACAEVCISCAEECEKMADDGEMIFCVSSCRSCAESCSDMAS